MSLLWRDRLVVALAPAHLSVVRLGKGLSPRLVRQTVVRLQPDPQHPWKAGIAELSSLIEDRLWKTSGIDILLSSVLMRYAVIPGDALVSKYSEREALAKIVFRKTFGNLCNDWEVAIGTTRNDASSLGAATPMALLGDLREGIGRRTKIHSIRPTLVEVFNRVRPTLSSKPATLALIESGRIIIAQVAQSGWTSVNSRTCAEDDSGALARLLEEEASLRPFPDGAVLWVRDLSGIAAVPPALQSRVRIIPPPWPGLAAETILP